MPDINSENNQSSFFEATRPDDLRASSETLFDETSETMSVIDTAITKKMKEYGEIANGKMGTRKELFFPNYNFYDNK